METNNTTIDVPANRESSHIPATTTQNLDNQDLKDLPDSILPPPITFRKRITRRWNNYKDSIRGVVCFLLFVTSVNSLLYMVGALDKPMNAFKPKWLATIITLILVTIGCCFVCGIINTGFEMYRRHCEDMKNYQTIILTRDSESIEGLARKILKISQLRERIMKDYEDFRNEPCRFELWSIQMREEGYKRDIAEIDNKIRELTRDLHVMKELLEHHETPAQRLDKANSIMQELMPRLSRAGSSDSLTSIVEMDRIINRD